jgi:WD40 repeat protein
MKQINSKYFYPLVILFMAVGLAACSTTATPAVQPTTSPISAATLPADQGAVPSPIPTLLAPAAKFTSTLPSPTASATPTATPTPAPQPIGYANAANLQIVRDLQNYDNNIEMFSHAVSQEARLAAVAGCQLEADSQCHMKTNFSLFDLNSGQKLMELEYLSPAIQVLAFSPDGSVLAAAGCDISLYIYGEVDTICDLPRAWLVNTQTGKVIAEFKGYTSHVLDFAFSPDSSTVFTSVVYDRFLGDGDHVIRVYDARTGEKLATIETGMITCTHMNLEMSADGHFLVASVTSACDSQSFVAWWDVLDPVHARLVEQADSFSRFRLSPDGTQILLNNRKDNTIVLFDLATGARLKLIPNVPYQSSLNTYDYLNDSNTVILDVSKEYDIIDLASGRVSHRITLPSGGYTTPYLLSPDLGTLFTFDYTDPWVVNVWEIASWQSYTLHLDPNNTLDLQQSLRKDSLFFSPDGTQMVASDLGSGYIRSQVWGFAGPLQDLASQALRHYFDLLSNGEYQAAAQMYLPYSDASAEIGANALLYQVFPSDYLQSLVPELAVTDIPGLLTLLCQNPVFPCMPVKDVTYPAQLWDNLYRFTVTFAGPNGELAAWPLCKNVPAARYCYHRNGDFEFYVLQRTDGSFSIVDGLPPAIELRVKQ